MIKSMFHRVKNMTANLDKVTVGHISYMVILSYFFCKGNIYVCLNHIEKMEDNDYDEPSTA